MQPWRSFLQEYCTLQEFGIADARTFAQS